MKLAYVVAMANIKILLDGLTFPEGPRWRDGRLWLSDMHDNRVLTVDLNGRSQTVCEVENQPSGLGWLPDGRLLVVSMADRRLLRLEPEGLVLHADLSALATYHCNDMVVDGQGRAYVGNFGSEISEGATPMAAALILVTPDGDARIVAEDLQFPNGSVITPDGKTLIVGESWGARLTAFDLQPDGSLTNRRVWAELPGALPDGCCIDAESAIWVASPITREVIRVNEGGEVTQRVATEQMAIACMLGGEDRKTLFMLTAPSVEAEECQKLRGARVEMLAVTVPGAGLP
ncbi:MAG: SMP-30/gluconolactonase/LRE family protein [Myxococcota bacterium]